MKNLSIKIKLILSLVIMLILMLVIGGLSMLFMGNNQSAYGEATENTQMIRATLEREIAHLAWLNELSDSFLFERAFAGQLDHTLCAFGEWYYAFIDSDEYNRSSQELRTTFDNMEDPHQRLHQSAQRINQLVDGGGDNARVEALAVFQTDTHGAIDELRAHFAQLSLLLGEENVVILSNVDEVTNSSRLYIIGLLGAALLIFVIVVIFITRGVISPLNQIVSKMQELAENGGDLTQKVNTDSTDELGALATAVNGILGTLRDIVKQSMDTAQNIVQSSEGVSASSEEMTSSLEEVAASTNDFAQASHTLSEKTQIMNGVSQTINEKSVAGNKSIESAMVQMEKTTVMIKDLKEVIETLDDKSNEIGNIVDTIKGIADQTNLLALNAAIEAARAGEQGRGFAVVAEEVRKLAEQSAVAASEITDLVTATQNQSQKAVSDMDNGVQEVAQGTEVITATGEIFKEILAGIQDVAQQIHDVAGTSQEISAGSQEISASVEEQSATMESVSIAAQDLCLVAERLTEEMSKFTV